MKPTLNRYYCIAAGKHKTLFSSEKKALNFIRFNREEFVLKGATPPYRVYYCVLCIGWHVTSQPDENARILDIHDRWLLHWLVAINAARRVIQLLLIGCFCASYK